MFTERNFIFLCRGNEFALSLTEHFSLLSRGAILHSLGVSEVCLTECYDNTVWEAAQCVGRVSESHTHQATLNGGAAHWYSGSPQLLSITFGNSTAANISIIICSVTGG